MLKYGPCPLIHSLATVTAFIFSSPSSKDMGSRLHDPQARTWKYALLVMLVWCSEIICFNYRRFRTWVTWNTDVKVDPECNRASKECVALPVLVVAVTGACLAG